MNIFLGLMFYGIIIAIIIYYVKKRKRKKEEQEYQLKMLEEARIAEKARIAEEERIAKEARILKYKTILNKFPQTIKKKLDGYVNYVRLSSAANLLLVGCPQKYISKILEVMAFDVGGVIGS